MARAAKLKGIDKMATCKADRLIQYFRIAIIVLIAACASCGDGSYTATGLAGKGQLPQEVPGKAGLPDNPQSLAPELQLAVEQFQPQEDIDTDVLMQLKSALITALLENDNLRSGSAVPDGPANEIYDLAVDGTSSQYEFSWTYHNVGDYDRNGETNIADLTPIGKHLGKSTASPDWESASAADGDGNGLITIADVTPIGAHFNSQVSGFELESAPSQTGAWQPLMQQDLTPTLDKALGRCSITVSAPADNFFRVHAKDSVSNSGQNSNMVSFETVAEAIDEGLGGAGGVEYGDPIGEFLGITAFSNSPVNHIYPEPYGQYGYQYQCVQYCRAFSAQRWGFDIGKGHAYMFWNKRNTEPLVEGFENGGSVPPQPGDIVCWSGGKYGHVAVVCEVPAGPPSGWTWITLIEQNVKPFEDGKVKLTLTGGSNVVIPNRGMHADGWLRPRASGPAQPPVNLHVSEGDPAFAGSINLDWDAPSSGPVPSSYNVRRVGIGFSDNATFQSGTTDFIDSTVQTGSSHKYQYYVSSNSFGYPPSNEIAAPEQGWAFDGTPTGYSITGALDKPDFWIPHAVRLSPGNRSVQTNTLGVFNFTDIADGSYTVAPDTLAGYNWNPASKPVNVSGANVTNVDFTAVPIDPGNQPPTVTLSADVESGAAPLSVSFTANASDSDGFIDDYEWDLDADGIYNESGTELNRKGWATASWTYETVGSYHPKVRVTDNDNAIATDDILISAGSSGYSEVENNDSTSQANNISFPLSNFTGHVGNGGYDGDSKDYLKFSCSEGALLDGVLTFDDGSGKITISLRDSADKEVAYFNYGGNTVNFTWGLKAGTYYLRVQQWTGGSDYSINASIVFPGYDELEDNDSYTDANSITFPLVEFYGHIGDFGYDGDPKDYLKFTCGDGALLDGTMLFDDATGKLGISLRNSSDSEINYFNYAANKVDFKWGLQAGTYYLKIVEWTGYTDYNINATLTYPGYTEAEDNDAFGSANLVSLPVADFLGHVGYFGYDGDSKDYIKFTIGGTQDVTIMLDYDDSSGNINFELRNSGNSWLDDGGSGNTGHRETTINLTAGTYYIKVYNFTGYSDYLLDVS